VNWSHFMHVVILEINSASWVSGGILFIDFLKVLSIVLVLPFLLLFLVNSNQSSTTEIRHAFYFKNTFFLCMFYFWRVFISLPSSSLIFSPTMSSLPLILASEVYISNIVIFFSRLLIWVT
jgi:hypothetical protein